MPYPLSPLPYRSAFRSLGSLMAGAISEQTSNGEPLTNNIDRKSRPRFEPGASSDHRGRTRITVGLSTTFFPAFLGLGVRYMFLFCLFPSHLYFFALFFSLLLLLRGTIVNRTYGTHKNLYIHLFSPTIFGPIYYGPP